MVNEFHLPAAMNCVPELLKKSGPVQFPDGRLMISNREHQDLCKEIASKIAREDEDADDLAFQIAKISGKELQSKMGKPVLWTLFLIIVIIIVIIIIVT